MLILECQSKIKNIEDVDRNRINMLRQHNLSHVQEAIIWLRANKDKFRAPIYEPLIVSVRLSIYLYIDIYWLRLLIFVRFINCASSSNLIDLS